MGFYQHFRTFFTSGDSLRPDPQPVPPMPGDWPSDAAVVITLTAVIVPACIALLLILYRHERRRA